MLVRRYGKRKLRKTRFSVVPKNRFMKPLSTVIGKLCCLLLWAISSNCSRNHAGSPADWHSALSELGKVYRNVDISPMLAAASCDKPFLEKAGFKPYLLEFFGPKTDDIRIVEIRVSVLWQGASLPADDHFQIRVGTCELVSAKVYDETPIELKRLSNSRFHLILVTFSLSSEQLNNLTQNIVTTGQSVGLGDKVGNMWSLEIGNRILEFEKSRQVMSSTAAKHPTILRIALGQSDVHPKR